MTTEEIFTNLCTHMIKGLMFHEQLSHYYHFLNLEGYKCCHEYHYLCETLSHIKLQRFYINHYDKLIPEERISGPEVIPSLWYKSSRGDVDTTTRKGAVRAGVEKWLEWEEDTHKCYLDAYLQLKELNETAAMHFVKELLIDVEEEIQTAKKKLLDLSTVDFSISYIAGQQEGLYKKYKEEKKKIFEKG